jgi:HTH-type transcriptional regulator, competence development regulator
MRGNRGGKGPGRLIRALRIHRGLSIRTLGQRANVAAGYISELENGRKLEPGLDVLRRLAKALGAPLSDLIE